MSFYRRFHSIGENLKYLMFMPALIVTLALIIFPFGYCIFLSLHDYNIELPFLGMKFIGFENYYRLILDPRVHNGMIISLKLIGIALPIEFLLGFLTAILLHYRRFRGEKIVRISLILPVVIPPVVVGLTWKILYNPSFGIINFYLKRLGIVAPSWLTDPQWVIFAIAITDVWQWFPLMALILLAGLDSISIELIEAARVDGASYLNVVRYIFIPSIKPLISFAIILRMIDIFKMFDVIYVMTGGGPGISSETLHFYAYKIGLAHGGNISYASSIALILLFTIELFSIIILRSLGRR